MIKIKSPLISASLIASILFLAIVSLGLSLSILPLYINKIIGYSAFYVGLVVVAESISTLFSRAYAGRYSDKYGPRKGMTLGISLTIFSGVLFLLVILLINNNICAYIIILLSRVSMGIGESLIFTCSGTWPIGLVGREHAGKIMSWVGIAMFIGLAIGNYFGALSYYYSGIALSALIMTLIPALGFIIILIVKPVQLTENHSHVTLSFAIKRIWKAGTGFALANIGYASITTFLILYFIDNGWDKQSPLALSLFGFGYVFARLTLGWKADSSGLKMVIFSLVIESLGLMLIAIPSSPYQAMIGSFLTGFGLSMVYPLLALPAIKSMPNKDIGLALSTYESCFDIGILFSGFAGGVIVSFFGYNAVFIFAFLCSLSAVFPAILSYKQIDG